MQTWVEHLPNLTPTQVSLEQSSCKIDRVASDSCNEDKTINSLQEYKPPSLDSVCSNVTRHLNI